MTPVSETRRRWGGSDRSFRADRPSPTDPRRPSIRSSAAGAPTSLAIRS